MSNGEIKSTWAAVQDHTRHFSDFTFVYPVISRRSKGLSIGVNLNPDKVCNFDCIYCEVDRRIPGAVTEVDLCQMKDELTAMVRFAKDGGLAKEPKFNEVPWLTREVKDIAFSGDGEPTMIQNFAECVETVVEVQQFEGLDEAKIVLITDARVDGIALQLGLRADMIQHLYRHQQANNMEWRATGEENPRFPLIGGLPARIRVPVKSHLGPEGILMERIALYFLP